MSLCPNCHRENYPNVRVCRHCGSILPSDTYKNSSNNNTHVKTNLNSPIMEELITDDLPQIIGQLIEEDNFSNDIADDLIDDIVDDNHNILNDIIDDYSPEQQNPPYPQYQRQQNPPYPQYQGQQNPPSPQHLQISNNSSETSNTSTLLKNFFQQRQTYQPPEIKKCLDNQDVARLYWDDYISVSHPHYFWDDWLKALAPTEKTLEHRILILGFDPTNSRIEPLLQFFCGRDFEIQLAEYPSEGIAYLYQEIPNLFLLRFDYPLENWAPLLRDMSRSKQLKTIPSLLFCDMPLDGMLLSTLKELNCIVFYKENVKQDIIF